MKYLSHFFFLMLLFAACTEKAIPEKSGPPDIVLIIGHGNSALDYGFMQSKIAKTPHIDRLAETGVVFINGYVPGPDAEENQRALLTGIDPGHYNNISDSLMALDLQRMLFKDKTEMERWKNNYAKQSIGSFQTLPKALKSAGYSTFNYRNHVAFDATTAGFEYTYEINNKIEPAVFYHLKEVESPAFIVFEVPNPTGEIPAIYATHYNEMDTTTKARRYFSRCTYKDAKIGNFLEQLARARKNKPTMIIYTQDSGWETDVDLSYRTPIVFSGASVPQTRQHKNALIHLCDLQPTLLDFIGSQDARLPVDGQSQLEVLQGKKEKVRNSIIGYLPDGNYNRNHVFFFTLSGDNKTRRIFDLSYDPYCLDNVIEYHPAKTKRYIKEITAFRGE